MTERGAHPQDLELIAAFIDRRMSEEDRRAFMSRLDAEEDLYEVFVETVRFRDQASGRPAEVVEHPASGRRWGRLAAIAALVAVAVATPVVLRNLPAARYAPQLVADGTLGAVLDERWLVKDWVVLRGSGPGTDRFDSAFRLGVRQVDLEVALHLARADDGELLAAAIEHQLDSVELASPFQVAYAEVGSLVAEPARALELAESTERQLREHLGEAAIAFDLGMWTEAGVLASRSGNTGLLGSRAFRGALEEFRAAGWDSYAAELDEIARLLGVPPERLDLPRLERAFTAIVDKT